MPRQRSMGGKARLGSVRKLLIVGAMKPGSNTQLGVSAKRFGRDDQGPLQSRGDPQAQAVAILRSSGICDPRIGPLVQPSPAAGAHRQHSVCRSRRSILCGREQHRYGSLTHNIMPPADPARFRVPQRRSS